MKTRTRFVIIAILSLYASFLANIILSFLGREQLSDAFCVTWMSSFTIELGLLAGITIKSKDE